MAFNIQLGDHFTPSERKEAQFLIGAYNIAADTQMGFFKQAWAGWPSDETKPQPNRADDVAQNMLDKSMQYAFGDLWKP